MGVDFIRNKRLPHNKAWSRQFYGRSIDLFAGAGGNTKQVFRASTAQGHVLRPGDDVLVRKTSDGGVIVSKDICQVAAVANPSRSLLQALEILEGVMPGRVYQSLNDVGVTDIEYEV